jgi:uncharacterized protein YabE (DUF348 family)
VAKKSFVIRHQFGLGIFLSVFVFVFAAFGLVAANGEAVHPSDRHLVDLSVDGREEIIPSRAATVGEFLAKQSIVLDTHDLVLPATNEKIDSDNFKIEVSYAEPTTIVDEDGKTVSLLSPYQDPREAVEKAGITLYPVDSVELDYPGDPGSSYIIGRKLVIKRATLIFVNVYGTIVEHRTNKKVVADVLTEMSVLPEAEDSVLPSYATVVTPNLLISITRFGQEMINVEEVIAAPTETIIDKNLPFGSSTIQEAGKAGRKLVTYQLTLENGAEKSRQQIQETVIEEPVKRVVVNGSNTVIAENKQAIMVAAGLSEADFAPADFIISHESGWCATKWQGQWGYCPTSYQEKYSGAETDTSLGYGLCQSTPAIKMATAGSDWRTNAITQLKWCTGYAVGRYGSWQNAYNAWTARAAIGSGWW